MTSQADRGVTSAAVLTLIGVAWTNLRRDRVAQAMTFLLPIIFFSIFATVFGGQGDSSRTPRVRVAVVDQDGSDFSRRLIAALRKESGLAVRTTKEEDGTGAPLDRDAAAALVRNGDVPVAAVIPPGLGAAFGAAGFGSAIPIALLADPSDPIAPNMVGGLLQKATMTAAPDLLIKGGLQQFEKYAGQMTPQQRAAVDAFLPRLAAGEGQSAAGAGGAPMGVSIQVEDVMRSTGQRDSLVSFYAAGVGVMFLLFSMVGQRRDGPARRSRLGHARAAPVHEAGDVGDPPRQVGVPRARRLRPAERDVPVGGARLRVAAFLARSRICRHDGRDCQPRRRHWR